MLKITRILKKYLFNKFWKNFVLHFVNKKKNIIFQVELNAYQ